MKTNNQTAGNGNRPKENTKQGNQAQKGKYMAAKKSAASGNIADLPEIDHAKPAAV